MTGFTYTVLARVESGTMQEGRKYTFQGMLSGHFGDVVTELGNVAIPVDQTTFDTTDIGDELRFVLELP